MIVEVFWATAISGILQDKVNAFIPLEQGAILLITFLH